MTVKKITLDLCFDDDFMPPDKFEALTSLNNWESECRPCPFFHFDDEYAESDCFLAIAVTGYDECPIKKFFKDK